MYLQCNSSVPLTDYNAVTFWLNGGNSPNQQVRVKSATADWTFGPVEVPLAAPATNTWTQYTVTFDQMQVSSMIRAFVFQYWLTGCIGVFRGFMLQSNTATAYTGTVYVDDIQLVKL